MTKRQLPSDHEKERVDAEKAEQLQREARQRKAAQLRQAVDWMLRDERGRLVWAWLFDRCGYNKPILMRAAGGDVLPLSTEALAAIREVYRDARKLALPDILARTEYEAEFGQPWPEPQAEEKKGDKKNA